MQYRARARHRQWAGVLIVASAAMVLAACGSGSSGSSTASPSGSSSAASTKAVDIAYFLVDQANPLDVAESAAVKAEAAAQGAKVTIFNGNNDPQTQANACQSALGTGRYNAFIIKSVSGPSMMSCAKQAIAAGDKVVALDTTLGPKDITAPQVPGLSASAVSLASTNGKGLVSLTKLACGNANPCQVIYLYGPPTFNFATETRQAFLQGIKSVSNVKIVADQSDNWVTDTSGADAKQLLQANPGVTVITNDCDQCAIAEQKALAASGEGGKVKIIGAGASGPGVAAIKAHKEFGSTVLLPRSIGKVAVDFAVKAVRGEALGNTQVDAANISNVGPFVDQQNVKKFTAQW